ncbi:MAG TPA: NAD(P)H-dependent oxidoreductase [Azoarcus taiwanensis]|nr:NAD(P)H-dependent oxidoreductase [Azoarcus taiwanensis]
MEVKRLIVIQHSMTGGTLQMAGALVAGAAAETEVNTRCLHATEAGPDDLLAADGYVFATPENLGTMSGLLKDFFDRCYYPVLDQLNGRPYATLICAGSDGQGAARQIERIVTGWRLKAIAPPLIVITHAQTPERILQPKRIGEEDLQRCRELGEALAAALALGVC